MIKIIRPINGIIASISVFIGALLTKIEQGFSIDDWISGSYIILPCLVCFFIISAGNAINDYVDIEIDKINKPDKPLIKCNCPKYYALIISIIFFILGIRLCLMLPKNMIMWTIIITAGILLYNFILKKFGIFGNLLIAAVCGMPFIYGSLYAGNYKTGIIPFIFAFLLHLAREIIKDIEDMEGEKILNYKSLTILYGKRKAIIISTIILLVLAIFILYPFVAKIYGWVYFLGIIILIYPVLFRVILKLIKEIIIEEEELTFVHRASNLLKIIMVFGLIILPFAYK